MRTRAVSTSPAAVLVAALAAASSSCRFSKEEQLESVAKDWSMTIRASQVIPVYPLTEDIQPGDVFLVQVPIDRQQKVYKEKGYLALDNHLARLDPVKYEDFYSHSFTIDGKKLLPREWMRPPAPTVDGTPAPAWRPAPHAAFPSYGFSVSRGGGLNLAVPVSGVPVGLSLLGSDAADGTINIKKASTIGVDTISLFRQLENWSVENRDFLRNFAPADGRTNYLRVVTRVYVTGELEVSLNDSSRAGAGVDAGVPKPVDLLTATTPTSTGDVKAVTIDDYKANLDKLNASLAADKVVKAATGEAQKLLPGGSLRVTAASSRSITMSEPLDPPLVLGYLGFDCAIAKDGFLGRPIPTHAVLDPDLTDSGVKYDSPMAEIYATGTPRAVYMALREMGAGAKPAVAGLDAMERYVPNDLVQYSTGQDRLLEFAVGTSTLKPQDGTPYLSFRDYRGRVADSVRALDRFLGLPGAFTLQRRDGTTVTVEPGSEVHQELVSARDALARTRDDAVMKAAEKTASGDAAAYYARQLQEN